MSQSMNEDCFSQFKIWEEKLLAKINANLTELNPELKSLAEIIRIETENITELENNQTMIQASLDIDIIWPNRNIKAPGNNPLFTRHAEEVVANNFDMKITNAGLNPKDVSGTLKIHQSNPTGVCRKRTQDFYMSFCPRACSRLCALRFLRSQLCQNRNILPPK